MQLTANDIQELSGLADGMGFGRNHDALRRALADHTRMSEALCKIKSKYPCATADAMSLVASEALGVRCYFAHPISDYGGSVRQRQAVAAIEAAGWTVENPDSPLHQELYQKHGMSHFTEVVESCDALAFLRFADGAIGAGVAKEVERALQLRIHVFDVSSGDLRSIGDMMPSPVLSVEETRARVRPGAG